MHVTVKVSHDGGGDVIVWVSGRARSVPVVSRKPPLCRLKLEVMFELF